MISTKSTLHGDKPFSKSPFSIDSSLAAAVHVGDALAVPVVVDDEDPVLEVRVWFNDADADGTGMMENMPPVTPGIPWLVVELR